LFCGRGSLNSAGYLFSEIRGYDIKYLLLFLPAAGNRNNNTGRLNNRGNNGNYWSSSENSNNNAWNLNFNRSNVNTNNNNRTNGLSLRCISAFNRAKHTGASGMSPYLYLVVSC
jgi:hypothetical protein